MLKWLETTESLVLTSLGVIASMTWGYSTDWDHEPLILFCTSSVTLLFIFFKMYAHKRASKEEQAHIKELIYIVNSKLTSAIPWAGEVWNTI